MAVDLIPESYMRELTHTVHDLSDSAEEQSDESKEYLYNDVMRRIGASERWVGLADYVDSWTEGDRFWVGIRGKMYVSEAFAAEYGTDEYPPDPVFRVLDDLPYKPLPGYRSTATQDEVVAGSIETYSQNDIYENMQDSTYGHVEDPYGPA